MKRPFINIVLTDIYVTIDRQLLTLIFICFENENGYGRMFYKRSLIKYAFLKNFILIFFTNQFWKLAVHIWRSSISFHSSLIKKKRGTIYMYITVTSETCSSVALVKLPQIFLWPLSKLKYPLRNRMDQRMCFVSFNTFYLIICWKLLRVNKMQQFLSVSELVKFYLQ